MEQKTKWDLLVVAGGIRSVELLVQPVDGGGPFALEVGVGQQDLVGGRARREERHQTFDTLHRATQQTTQFQSLTVLALVKPGKTQ